MNLKRLREDAQLTQKELAYACKCERSMIGKIENGKVNPSVSLAKRIANELGFDWTAFYEEEV